MKAEDLKPALGSVRFWVMCASFVVIVAGMKAATAIIVPFLLALFIAAICSPPFFWLQKKGIPQGLSLLIVIFGISLITFLIAVLLGSSVNNFSNALPGYEARLNSLTAGIMDWIKNSGFVDMEIKILDQISPGSVMQIAGNVFTGFSQLLSKSLVILILVVFILLELSIFRKKIYRNYR